MKIMLQIGLVLGICLLGNCAQALLPFAFPGSVISMILLFLLLRFSPLRPEHIRGQADFLLKNMGFFFIPAGVSILQEFALVQDVLVQLVVVCIVSTLVTFTATAMTVRFVMFLQRKMAARVVRSE